ncbi:MAG: hypothetical protein ACOVNR_08620 [Chitinophagaceae bacterium]
MAKLDTSATFKRLQSKYRLVIINEDTYEELVAFKLSRISVYTSFSVIFVLLISLTVALIVLTPLKYYIPGYGSRKSKAELQVLKMKTDSLELAIKHKELYLNNLKNILSGNEPLVLDTNAINEPEVEISRD